MGRTGFMLDSTHYLQACAIHRPARQIGSGTRWFVLAALAIVLAIQAAPVSAQSPAESFPSRPIRSVVPFDPGSGTDTATRMLGQQLEVVCLPKILAEIGVQRP